MTETKEKPQKEEPDLYKRAIKGGGWVFALQLGSQGLGLIKTIIVANCLLLEGLGIISVAIVLMDILRAFSESGFRAALVQKKEENVSDYLDTAWVISIIRGVILFIVLFFTAPLFASLKVSDENISLAISVIRVIGLCLLIQGFRNIGTVYFQKKMEFHKIFWIKTIGGLADTLLSIILVLIYHNVWSVVTARLISVCIGFVLSYRLCAYRPKFHFIPAKAKELWSFGKWLFGGQILGFIRTRGDDIFVWLYLGPIQLALYERAFRLSNVPVTHISGLLNQVLFPAYSKIQNDRPRLREAYLKVLKVTTLFSFPTSFLILSLGADFVHCFLPERMYPMIPALQILALQGLLKSEGSTRGPLFNAMKKPYLSLYYQLLRLLILSCLIYPLTRHWGFTGTAIATALTTFSVKPLGFLQSCKILNCSAMTLLKPNVYPFISAVAMSTALLYLNNVDILSVGKIAFFVKIIIGVMIYISVLYLLDCYSQQGFRDIIKEYLQAYCKRSQTT